MKSEPWGDALFCIFFFFIEGRDLRIVGCRCKMHHRACDERYSFLMTFVVVVERKKGV